MRLYLSSDSSVSTLHRTCTNHDPLRVSLKETYPGLVMYATRMSD